MKYRNILIVLITFSILSACGGGGGDKKEKEPPLSVTLSKSSILFEGEIGQDLPASQTVDYSFVGDDALIGYPPNVPEPDWLIVRQVSGNNMAGTLEFEVRPIKYEIGTLRTIVRFVTGKSDGSEVIYKDLNISFKINPPTDEPRFYVANNGIALVKTLETESLSKTIAINSNYGASPVDMVFSSDQSWLSYQFDGEFLTVNADPTGLAEGMHYANVSMTSNTAPMDKYVENIRVGLYILGTNEVKEQDLSLSGSSSNYYLAKDPIRPYIYLLGAGTGISAYNVYTSSLEFVMESPVGVSFNSLTISNDGKKLYAIVESSSGVKAMLHTLDLDSKTWLNSVEISEGSYSGNRDFVAVIRPDARELLFAVPGFLIDIETGVVLDKLRVYGEDPIWNSYKSSKDYAFTYGDRLMFSGSFSQPTDIYRTALGAVLNTDIVTTKTFIKLDDYRLSQTKAFAINKTGNLMAFAIGTSVHLYQYDSNGFAEIGQLSLGTVAVEDVEIDDFDNIYIGGGDQVKVYNFSGDFIAEYSGTSGYSFTWSGEHGITISSDGQKVIILKSSSNSIITSYSTIK
ncbi:MAG: hypothetical protein OEY96_05225 [Gammaproteobacteria bacterium]|nr:hypothetical protein [Gammaproteobacteria bacterium]